MDSKTKATYLGDGRFARVDGEYLVVYSHAQKDPGVYLNGHQLEKLLEFAVERGIEIRKKTPAEYLSKS